MPDRLLIDEPQTRDDRPRRVRARLVWWQFLLGIMAWFLVFVHAAKTVEISERIDRELAIFKAQLDADSDDIRRIVRSRLNLQVAIAQELGMTDAEILEVIGKDEEAQP